MSRRAALRAGRGREAAVAVAFGGRQWPPFRPSDYPDGPDDASRTLDAVRRAAQRYAATLLPAGVDRADLTVAAARAWYAARPETAPPFDPLARVQPRRANTGWTTDAPTVNPWMVYVEARLYAMRYGRRDWDALAAAWIAANPDAIYRPTAPTERETFGF
ncbi:hypothetical protein [Micromonospora sp. NPDC005305]|uniref:hypothetical protein n=1 Tax=Micromonospora sp. NPDC005305 TaxID=3156875 RepID=UPI0033B46EDA